MVQLSEGAIKKLMQGENVEDIILQYMGHKKLKNAERYRLLVNDGAEVTSFAMLSPLLNHLITEKILIDYAIIKVTKMATTLINNHEQQKRVIVILNLEILISGTNVGQPLGQAAIQMFDQSESEQLPQINPPAPAALSVLVTYNNKNNNNGPPPVLPRNNRVILVNPTRDNIMTPVAALTPYSKQWNIKVRVTSKSEKTRWNKPQSQGVLFSMNLMDASGEIKSVAFKEQCDQFFDKIKLGNIYWITKADVKIANKSFSVLKNDYEIVLRRDTEIFPCDEDEDMPQVAFNFTPIQEIDQLSPSTIVDVLGIVKSVGTIFNGNSKGRDYAKRDICLVDKSGGMVTLTLWNQQAERFTANNNSVLIGRYLQVSEYLGKKSLGQLNQSLLLIDPDTPEAHEIRGWYRTVGINENFLRISRIGFGTILAPFLTIAEAKCLRYGQLDQLNIYNLKATVNYIKPENSLYKACPSDNCYKKVNENLNGMFHCGKCNREYPNFNWRIIANVSLSDWSGNLWVTAFNDQAEVLLDTTANEFGRWKENDYNKYLDKLSEAGLKTYIFKLRMKLETFNGTSKLKTSILTITELDPITYCAKQLEKIRQNLRVPQT